MIAERAADLIRFGHSTSKGQQQVFAKHDHKLHKQQNYYPHVSGSLRSWQCSQVNGDLVSNRNCIVNLVGDKDIVYEDEIEIINPISQTRNNATRDVIKSLFAKLKRNNQQNDNKIKIDSSNLTNLNWSISDNNNLYLFDEIE